MLRIIPLVLAAALTGCSAAAPENRIEATITNDTFVPLVVKISTPMGPLTIMIPPKTTWSGGLDRRLIPSVVQARVEILGAQQ